MHLLFPWANSWRSSSTTLITVYAPFELTSTTAYLPAQLTSNSAGAHPMHIHGHAPQLVYRSSTLYNSATAKLPAFPIRRDTWMLQPLGVTVVRYQATNPGVWLIHCHMEWHVEAGLTATLIEAPTQLQTQRLPIPQAFKDQCTAQGIPTAGNAAGNTVNFHNLTGANTVSPPPKG